MVDVALVSVSERDLSKLETLESDMTEDVLLIAMTVSARDRRKPDAFGVGLQDETRRSRDRVVRQMPLEFARFSPKAMQGRQKISKEIRDASYIPYWAA